VAEAAKVVANGVLGFGEKVLELEARLRDVTGRWALTFSSASAAAFALFERLYEIHGPCLVVTPSLTFVSPVWAAAKVGHDIAFIDVGPDCVWSATEYVSFRTQNTIKRKIVAMPVLYGGVSGKGRDFGFLGDEIVVVDSAHCINPKLEYDYAFLSFHSQKPIAAAQGGSLLFNPDKLSEYPWFEKYRNFGRRQDGYSYEVVQTGFKFYLDNLNAVIAVEQLKHVQEGIKNREKSLQMLKDSFDSERLGRFLVHDEDSSHYLGTLILKSNLNNMDLIRHLDERGIQGTFHYPALHMQTGIIGNRERVTLPATEVFQTQIVNLPIHQGLTKFDIERIGLALDEF
jgi:dTDP-4-amino-4,6-dideoxygalactose transaminase